MILNIDTRSSIEKAHRHAKPAVTCLRRLRAGWSLPTQRLALANSLRELLRAPYLP